jgi:hypothetical protein
MYRAMPQLRSGILQITVANLLFIPPFTDFFGTTLFNCSQLFDITINPRIEVTKNSSNVIGVIQQSSISNLQCFAQALPYQ